MAASTVHEPETAGVGSAALLSLVKNCSDSVDGQS
jgi:hypothetical protein